MSIKVSKKYGNLLDIYFADDDALDWATVAALYSRSTGSVANVVEEASKKREAIISQYFIGYGHESIGDMVDVKMFIEQVPIFMAYLIESHSQFRGQESSTRYIDFSTQAPPRGFDEEFYSWYKKSIDLYRDVTDLISDEMIENNQPKDGRLPPLETRAIKARVFDITRCLIPAAAVTNVAWYGSINSLRMQLARMESWFPEATPHGVMVHRYVDEMRTALNEEYPEAATTKSITRVTDPWVYRAVASNSRPNLLSGSLDFGSMRDLNRHRIGKHSLMPMYETGEMHPWYIKKIKFFGVDLLEDVVQGKGITRSLLGHTGHYSYELDTIQMEYFVHLRSKPTVHPTLRSEVQRLCRVHKMSCDQTQDPIGYGYVLIRGKDTIVKGAQDVREDEAADN